MTQEVFSSGERFRGYVVERPIGRGGIGSIYLVRECQSDKRFALKILDPKVAESSPEYVKRFVREATIARKMQHPNLVAVRDSGYDKAKNVHFIVMDYVSGCTLRLAIAMGGAMPQNEALRVVICVALALAQGEQFGLVHRDIKPENIMIARDGSIKLVDLGVAKITGADSLMTMANTVLGTPSYISPEQACDSSSVDFRADIYSLGVIFFEMLSGRRPYECKNQSETLKFLMSSEPIPDIRTFVPDVSAKLSLLLKMMCEKNPAKRIASASVLLDALKRFGYDISPATTTVSSYSTPDGDKEFNYSEFSNVQRNDTLSFETQDEEIRSFINKRKRKKALNRCIAIAMSLLLMTALATMLLVVIARWTIP